jgi:4-hydroxy-tetrahydrodipicolinate reductase
MTPIKVIINGIPGNMATRAAEHVLKDPGLELLPFALTGPEITQDHALVGTVKVELIKPDRRRHWVDAVKQTQGPPAERTLVCVDYTHPNAVNENAAFYCDNGIPFVLGTTGGDRQHLTKTVEASEVPAVIAPNMGKQIVAFQAMMEYAARTFPGVFKGYRLEVKESHQKGKADTSGTAKAMIGYFNQLGTPFTNEQIVMERDPEVQLSQWGVPKAYLAGHGWHTYTLRSEDDTVLFQFTHNVNGRDIYAAGTIDAVHYLAQKIQEGTGGRVFTMIDVLKGT